MKAPKKKKNIKNIPNIASKLSVSFWHVEHLLAPNLTKPDSQ